MIPCRRSAPQTEAEIFAAMGIHPEPARAAHYDAARGVHVFATGTPSQTRARLARTENAAEPTTPPSSSDPPGDDVAGLARKALDALMDGDVATAMKLLQRIDGDGGTSADDDDETAPRERRATHRRRPRFASEPPPPARAMHPASTFVDGGPMRTETPSQARERLAARPANVRAMQSPEVTEENASAYGGPGWRAFPILEDGAA